MSSSSPDSRTILAFRLAGHYLDRRLPPGEILAAAGACGVQNTPPGAAELSLHARVSGLAPGEVRRALEEERSLLQAWSLRGAPTIFPTCDHAVFTRGLLAGDEDSLRHWLGGGAYLLAPAGLSATALLNLCEDVLLSVLDGQAKTKDQLGVEIASQALPRLPAPDRPAWQSPSPIVQGQTLGETLVRFALPILAQRGLCCHAERTGQQALLRRPDQWLTAAGPLPDISPGQTGAPPGEQADAIPGEQTAAPSGAPDGAPHGEHTGAPTDRQTAAPVVTTPPSVPHDDAPQAHELARRFLSAYGPATAVQFAAWAGLAPQQARRTWSDLAGEMFSTPAGALLERDRARWLDPQPVVGVRFLPAHDPYLQCRDRDRLLPERRLQRIVWRTAGSPGVILVDGVLSCAWRSRRQKGILQLSIEPFAPLSSTAQSALEEEASRLPSFFACHSINLLLV